MTQPGSLSSSLNRRAFLAATATAAVVSAATGRDYSRNAAPQRYPVRVRHDVADVTVLRQMICVDSTCCSASSIIPG